MCRYHGFFGCPYKARYACFSCRKAFKEPNIGTGIKCCPECKGILKPVYYDFKPPRKQAKGQWKKLEQKEDWDSCGCTGPGYVPKSLGELKNNYNKPIAHELTAKAKKDKKRKK